MNDHAELIKRLRDAAFQAEDDKTGKDTPESKLLRDAIAALEAGRSGEGETPLSDVELLRTLCEDVTDMHPTVRAQLQSLAKRIDAGVNIGVTRCRRCGEKCEVTIHSAAAPQQPVGVTGRLILAGARMDSLCWNIASAFKAGTAGEFAFPEQYRKSAEDCYTEWRAAKREYDRLSHQQPAPVSEGPRYSFGPDKSWVQADLSRDPGYWTAPVSEPAYTKADDLLHTIGGVEHPDAASGEGLPEPFGFYDADEGTFCRFAEGADPHLLDDYPEITYLYSRAQIIEARRLATTGQGDVERLVERIRNIPVPERGFHEGWRDEEIWQWALREAAVVTAMTLAPFGQQQEGQG